MTYIRQFLDLSTDHLDVASKAWLTDNARPRLGGSTYVGPPGWFTHCQEDVDRSGFVTDDDCRPAVLTAIYQHAITLGCDYVLFDGDAEADDRLPLFDEEGNRVPDECNHSWVTRDDNEEASYCELCGADGNG